MKLPLSHKRLVIFIGLSLFLHFVWLTGQTGYRVYIPDQAGSLMAIRLSERPAPLQHRTTQLTEKPTTTTPAKQPQDSGPTTAQQPSRENQLNSAMVLAEIRQKLTHHFVYPVMARRMGWQGQVLLGFQLDSTGNIQQVHIKQSSGYAILDDSAMSALYKIGTITVQRMEGFFGTWHLELPIIYRLEG